MERADRGVRRLQGAVRFRLDRHRFRDAAAQGLRPAYSISPWKSSDRRDMLRIGSVGRGVAGVGPAGDGPNHGGRGQHTAVFSRLQVGARQDFRRGDQSRTWRLRTAAAADARRTADARLDAPDRGRPGERLHRDRARPARIRRQQQAARRREPRQLLEARDGARPGRSDEEFRLRQVRRRRPRSRRPRRPPHGARPSPTR